ncbi:hypothetical protein RIR_jg28078.t1 [Rhizophagus irregularis DAOM 181602=DAOM 197198]|nr:hypothetical protein RIR_jg28078.t1 [Rhizophagus irregularis DAOM 181602=DAOM 197198]CAB4487171.1 unnamed protein product [Rhizophagus irregularis]
MFQTDLSLIFPTNFFQKHYTVKRKESVSPRLDRIVFIQVNPYKFQFGLRVPNKIYNYWALYNELPLWSKKYIAIFVYRP